MPPNVQIGPILFTRWQKKMITNNQFYNMKKKYLMPETEVLWLALEQQILNPSKNGNSHYLDVEDEEDPNGDFWK